MSPIIGNAIAIVLVALVLFFALRQVLKTRRNGGCGCGCGSCASACAKKGSSGACVQDEGQKPPKAP